MIRSHRYVVWLVLAGAAFSGCARPNVVPQNGNKYAIEARDAEQFVYVTYRWRGGKFSDAVELEQDFARWADEKGILKYAMGRYPTSKLWQLGFVTTQVPEETEFQGRKIESMSLPAGKWAVLKTKENTDYMFLLWKKFAGWLADDGYSVTKPVYEVYPDILNTDIEEDQSRGEIRYPLPPISD